MISRPLPWHIGPAGKAKRKFVSRAEAKVWLAERGQIGSIYNCDNCGAVHVGHLKARSDVRKRLDAKRAGAAKRQADAATRAAREAALAADLGRYRLAQRLAIRDARESFWWQEVGS